MTRTNIVLLSLLATLAVPALAHAGVPWEKITGSERFELVLDDEGVLDHETGLVWERHPIGQEGAMSGAQHHCGNQVVGGRMGWRLPTLAELTSLLNPCTGFCPGDAELPNWHPFQGIDVGTDAHAGYWTSTVELSKASSRYMVYFRRRLTHVVQRSFTSGHSGNVWCVRGDTGA